MPDIIVIGGGHNGLTAAARLAKQGRDVHLFERCDSLGGLSQGEEFHPGYRHEGVYQETGGLSDKVVAGLDLASHGLQRGAERTPVLLPEEDGPGRVITHLMPDVPGHAEWRASCELYARVLAPLFRNAPPDALNPTLATLVEVGRTALTLRRLGKRDMLELLRLAPTCVADWMNESFEDPLLKAGLALPAISGTWLAPWSAGSTLNLLLQEVLAAGEVSGGAAAAAEALAAAAKASGATLRTGAQVARILSEDGSVSGIELEGGERIEASKVLATCDPKHALLDLVHPRDLTQRDTHRISSFRSRGTTAVVHLALSGPLEFSSKPGESFSRARVVTDLDGLERSFDGIKYGELPARPSLEVRVADASCAPAGCASVSVLASFVPYDLKGGWDDSARESVGELVVETLARVAPTVRERIVGSQVLTPMDLEERYALTGGHLHHGEHALDQLLLRPSPEMARYEAPLGGLYLGGGGSHPGGGLTGLPGWLGAEAIARS